MIQSAAIRDAIENDHPPAVLLNDEQHLPLSRARLEFQIDPPPSISTIWRWARELGLKITRIGGKNYLTRKAIREFKDSQVVNFGRPAPSTIARRQTPSAREKSIAKAANEIKDLVSRRPSKQAKRKAS